MAYALLDSRNETNVCIFEREDRLGGKIFDFNFTQAPDVAVGKPKVILYPHIFRIKIVLPLLHSGMVKFYLFKRSPVFTVRQRRKINGKLFSG